MRLLAVAAAVLLSLGSLGTAAVIVVPPVEEQLVEGHTVWTVIEAVQVASRTQEFAAAVAVLVQQRQEKTSLSKFPGILWFNDQYLEHPTQSSSKSTSNRVPCTGSVIAVNRGDLVVDQDLYGNWTLINPTYVESYFITDVNERIWMVDLWNTTYGRYAWSVAIAGNSATGGVPDDGKCNGSAFSSCSMNRSRPLACSYPPSNARVKNPGDHGKGYPCQGCAAIRYNALLYFRLHHLDVPGPPKNHTERSGDDWWQDVAGCHAAQTHNSPCPDGDDDREGNSHPYAPEQVFVPRAGRGNHGGSDECAGAPVCHATRDVDIYFGYVVPPLQRHFVVRDTSGADAPWHCHDDHLHCHPEDTERMLAEQGGTFVNDPVRP